MNLDEDRVNYDGYESPEEWVDSEEEQDDEGDDTDNPAQEAPGRAGNIGEQGGQQNNPATGALGKGGEGLDDSAQTINPAQAASGEESDEDEEAQATPSKREQLGDIPAEWVKTQRDKEKLVFRGALYTINVASRSGEYLYARCDQRNGCTSRIWLTAEGKLLHAHTGKHNHEATPWRPENAKLKDRQMELIEGNTDLMPMQVIERTTQDLSPTHRVFLPRKDHMTSAVARRKRSILGLPAAPKDFCFDIPVSLRTFSNGGLFVLNDTGKEDRKRIIVFGDPSARPTLSSVQAIYGDGTYDRCPLRHQSGYKKKKFTQCYVLMVERESRIAQRPTPAQGAPGGGGGAQRPTPAQGAPGEVNRVHYPVLHALLPAHDEETYARFLAIVKQRQLQVFPELRPTRFKSDYEMAVINQVQKAYPGIKCEGDSFHFDQAVMRRLQKIGLLDAYRADLNLYHQVRLLLTVMFVPLRHVLGYWSDVIKPLIVDRRLNPLIDYMERVWIGKPPAGGQRGVKPMFAPELWSQYRCVVEKRPRHNNHMESNNHKLQRLIKPNPSMWDFMEGLRSAYRGDFNLIYQDWVNGVLTKRRTADIARDRSIYNQVSRWKDAEGARPRLRPAEWAQGMVRAMQPV